MLGSDYLKYARLLVPDQVGNMRDARIIDAVSPTTDADVVHFEVIEDDWHWAYSAFLNFLSFLYVHSGMWSCVILQTFTDLRSPLLKDCRVRASLCYCVAYVCRTQRLRLCLCC